MRDDVDHGWAAAVADPGVRIHTSSLHTRVSSSSGVRVRDTGKPTRSKIRWWNPFHCRCRWHNLQSMDMTRVREASRVKTHGVNTRIACAAVVPPSFRESARLDVREGTIIPACTCNKQITRGGNQTMCQCGQPTLSWAREDRAHQNSFMSPTGRQLGVAIQEDVTICAEAR